ncbi:MAG: ABC transporter permease [Bacteroidales bacterium]|nr:ABC transporter permease [Bacteroidales bacterium]
MKPADIISLAVNNMTQNKFRTAVTILGVAIGIGSLSSMVAIGQGISENISNTLVSNDVFTGMTVSSRDADYSNYGSLGNAFYDEAMVPLNDSAVAEIEKIPQVTVVFPETIKHAEIVFGEHKTKSNIKSVPALMGNFKPFDNMAYGSFYTKDNENSIVLSKAALFKLGIKIEGDIDFGKTTNGEVIPADSIIGHKINIVTKVFDPSKMNMDTPDIPVKNDTTSLTIVGITENNPLTAGMLSGGIFLPSLTCEKIPSVDIKLIYEIYNGIDSDLTQYNSVYVKVYNFKELKTVKNKIENMGFVVFSVGDKLEDIEKVFMLIDMLLAAIGIIAITVSVFGIINTMTMAIYERRKEIGIMKAIGATQLQIKLIFYIESGITGAIGGLLGAFAGYWVAKSASEAVRSQLSNIINTHSDLFVFSWQLAVAAVAIAAAATIAAAVYPAFKAARIDPLEALRRE